MKALKLPFIKVFFIILTSCGNSSPKNETAIQDTSIEQQSLFDNPKKLIEILSQNGIGELKEWSNPMEIGWGSLTDYYQFGNQKDGIGMQNNIAYYLEGNENKVKKLTINLNINNPKEKRDALKFLNDVTEKTFRSLNLEMPAEVSIAILDSKAIKADVNNFTTSLELEKSKIETWKVNIERK